VKPSVNQPYTSPSAPRVGVAAVLPPEPREARRRSELQRLLLPATGEIHRAGEASLRGGDIGARAEQMQLAFETDHLGREKSLAAGVTDRRERPAPFVDVPRLGAERGQHAEGEGAAPHRAAHAHEPAVHVGHLAGTEALAPHARRDDDGEIGPMPEPVRGRELEHLL
jgi:hypothetical protein